MSRSFNNNDNSFNTTGFFNNNQNSFNRHDNCYNTTNINNTTNVNNTTVDDRSEILAWLSPLEPRVRHRDIRARRIDSLGAWLLETEEFQRWYNGSRADASYRPTLFCDGAAGVGKSHTTSLVIDRLCDEVVEGDTTVVCFYFDFAARSEQSPANILGSLLRQLVGGEGEIPEAIARDFRNDRRAIGGRGLQVSGVLKMFQAIAATRRIFICVDALDECVPEYRTVILEALGQILQGAPNASLFMTGRPHVRDEVERKLGGAATFIFIRATEDGVLRFLREKLKKDAIPNMMSSPLEGDIMRSIPAMSTETFLPASLHIEAILRSTTIAGRSKTLKSIKDRSGLGDPYGAALERIKAQDEKNAKLGMAALTWVCHSKRPLHKDELCHALAVELGAGGFDPRRISSIGTLLDSCQGLIVVDSEASTVRLIHYTAKKYLCSYPGLFSRPHSILAETCLTYLNSPQVKNLARHSLPPPQSMPFLNYSARYWGTHANKDFSDHVMALALELLNQYEEHISAVSLLEQVPSPGLTKAIATSPRFSGLHCASFFGIVELVTILIYDGGYEVDQQDYAGNTPLGWAAVNGHEVVVKTLLEQGNVDPNRRNKDGQTPLVCAASNGHEGVVKLLLGRADVDPNLSDMAGNGPLGYATSHGHEEVVELLLERENIDPNRRNKDGQTPLMYAAWSGHEGVVKLLLEREDVNPNLPDEAGRVPLGYAGRHEGVVKLLLEREDIDPNYRNKLGQTLLVCAAGSGLEGIVQLLLKREDVDPNLSDEDGDGPLGWAATNGREGVVKLLLQRENVDPNRRNKEGRTPLACAVCDGHEGVVKLLLERGDVDPYLRDNFLQTPLSYATWKGHKGIVQLLRARQSVETPGASDRRERKRDVLIRMAFSFLD